MLLTFVVETVQQFKAGRCFSSNELNNFKVFLSLSLPHVCLGFIDVLVRLNITSNEVNALCEVLHYMNNRV